MTRCSLILALLALSACRGTPPPDAARYESQLSLRIADARTEFAVGSAIVLNATFENPGRGIATLIGPQDGSYRALLAPEYEVSVVRTDGTTPSDAVAACENYGGVYDETSLLALDPGEGRTLRLHTPFYPESANSALPH